MPEKLVAKRRSAQEMLETLRLLWALNQGDNGQVQAGIIDTQIGILEWCLGLSDENPLEGWAFDSDLMNVEIHDDDKAEA